MKVFDSLRYGKENAIPSKTLAKAMGFRSVLDLQKQIELERAAGALNAATGQESIAGWYDG